MAMNHLKSILFPLFLTTFMLLSSKYSIQTEARYLLETTTPEHLHEEPELPLPELPHDLPSLPKPEIPALPKVELPPLPEFPKPELPTLPKLPEFPKPELPKLPELPHDLPEQTHPAKLPTTTPAINNP